MPTIRSILCPVDFSDPSRVAVQWAAAIARHRESTLTVFSVVDPLLAQAADIRFGVDLATADATPALRDFVDAALPESVRQGLRLQLNVTVGAPAAAILQAAETQQADLIVMGTHGLGGLRKLLLGSTTEEVLRGTARAVLVTPVGAAPASAPDDPPVRLRKLLVATDFRDGAMAAMSWAANLATDLRLPVVLAHVVEPVSVPWRWQALAADFEGDRIASGQRMLARLAAGFRDAVEYDVSIGAPAETIAAVRTHYGADLIVLGLSNAEDSPSHPRGSIAYRLLRLAHAPVVVVPAQAGHRRGNGTSGERGRCHAASLPAVLGF